MPNRKQDPVAAPGAGDRVHVSDIKQQLRKWARDKKRLLLASRLGRGGALILLCGYIDNLGSNTFGFDIPKRGCVWGLQFSRYNGFFKGRNAKLDAAYVALVKRRKRRDVEVVLISEIEGPLSEERLLALAKASGQVH